MKFADVLGSRALAVFAFASAAAVLAGCATFSGPEGAVKSRANDFWQARLEGRPDKAYQLTAPSYRQVRDLQHYRVRNAGLGARAVEVRSVACEAERCIAQLRLEVVPPVVAMHMAPIEMYSEDVWILEDGKWWHYEAP